MPARTIMRGSPLALLDDEASRTNNIGAFHRHFEKDSDQEPGFIFAA